MISNLMKRALSQSLISIKQSYEAWLIVLRLTLPALLITRLLLWFDLVPYVARVFEPMMSLMGLPPAAALIWVTAMLANLYAGIFIFITLIPVMGPLSVCQATILGSLMVIAHNLLMEGQVCRGAGVSPLRVTTLRVVLALVFGILIFQVSKLTGWGLETSTVLINFSSDPVPPWGTWALNTVEHLVLVFFIIAALMLLMEILKWLGLTRLVMKLMGPPLKLVGIGESALMITIIGNVLGLGYGGGLIIAESRSGRISPADVYGSITFMAVCHSLVEDSLLMMALGGSFWGLVVGRLAFALLLTALITRLARSAWGHAVLVGKAYKN